MVLVLATLEVINDSNSEWRIEVARWKKVRAALSIHTTSYIAKTVYVSRDRRDSFTPNSGRHHI